jgi:hypothetical protein
MKRQRKQLRSEQGKLAATNVAIEALGSQRADEATTQNSHADAASQLKKAVKVRVHRLPRWITGMHGS